MSTRCQMLVSGHDAIIYRHSDGYPGGDGGVLAELLPILRDFTASHGWDPFYLTAQIVAEFVKNNRLAWDQLQEKLAENRPDRLANRYVYSPGHGVEALTGNLHGDIHFLYIIERTHVEVRVPSKKFWDGPSLSNTKVFLKVRFDGTTYRGKPGDVSKSIAESRRTTIFSVPKPQTSQRQLDL